jgi:hypothetical protein
MGVAAGEVAGAVDPEGKHPVREGVIAETCVAAGVALQITALGILYKLSTNMANPASKLTMDARGITMEVQPSAVAGITVGVKGAASHDPYVLVHPGIAGAGKWLQLVCGNQSILLDSAPNPEKINIVKNTAASVPQGHITVDATGVIAEYGNATANAGRIEVNSTGVIINNQTPAPGTSQLTVQTNKAKLEQGDANVEMTGNKLTLAGPQGIDIGGGAITVDANHIISLGGIPIPPPPPPPYRPRPPQLNIRRPPPPQPPPTAPLVPGHSGAI